TSSRPGGPEVPILLHRRCITDPADGEVHRRTRLWRSLAQRTSGRARDTRASRLSGDRPPASLRDLVDEQGRIQSGPAVQSVLPADLSIDLAHRDAGIPTAAFV